MKWGVTGFLVVFAAFILLLIFNPNLSCFGKKVRSPFYPLVRRRRMKDAERAKTLKTTDYGFHLSDDDAASPSRPAPAADDAQKKTRDYGFKLD
jgi:hypothetical protein